MICLKHNVWFVEINPNRFGCYAISYGCPVCVGLIRARVKLDQARYAKYRGYENKDNFKCRSVKG